MKKIPVVIETIEMGNDNTDALDWQNMGLAAICYEGENPSIYMVVVGIGESSKQKLYEMLDNDGRFQYDLS